MAIATHHSRGCSLTRTWSFRLAGVPLLATVEFAGHGQRALGESASANIKRGKGKSSLSSSGDVFCMAEGGWIQTLQSQKPINARPLCEGCGNALWTSQLRRNSTSLEESKPGKQYFYVFVYPFWTTVVYFCFSFVNSCLPRKLLKLDQLYHISCAFQKMLPPTLCFTEFSTLSPHKTPAYSLIHNSDDFSNIAKTATFERTPLSFWMAMPYTGKDAASVGCCECTESDETKHASMYYHFFDSRAIHCCQVHIGGSPESMRIAGANCH